MGLDRAQFVDRALRAGLAAGAIIALDHRDQGVLGDTHTLEFGNHPAELLVLIGQLRGGDFHRARGKCLLLRREAFPRRDTCRARGQLCAPGHDPHGELAAKGLLAHPVPALVELALEPGNHFGRRLVRSVGRSRCPIDQERLFGCGGLLVVDPADDIAGKAAFNHVACAIIGIDQIGAAIEVGRELVGIAAHEAEPVFEAEAGRPAVERPGLAAFVARHIVMLAEHRGVVAIEPQYLRQCRSFGQDLAAIAGEVRRQIG